MRALFANLRKEEEQTRRTEWAVNIPRSKLVSSDSLHIRLERSLQEYIKDPWFVAARPCVYVVAYQIQSLFAPAADY